MTTTRKIRFIFYNVPIGFGHPVNDTIVIYTSSLPVNWGTPKENRCSHVEVWIADENNDFGTKDCWKGYCFSSTNRGNSSGVRFAPASEVLDHPENWKYIEVEICSTLFTQWYNYASSQVGKQYDWLGIYGFAVPFDIDDPKKWYCSEISNDSARRLKVIKSRHNKISPIHFCNTLCKELNTKVRDLV